MNGKCLFPKGKHEGGLKGIKYFKLLLCIVCYERMVNDWSLSIDCLITLSVQQNSEGMDRVT